MSWPTSDPGACVYSFCHRSLVKNTVDCLRAVGIKPTDVSPRNVVYDGSRLTIIDFVDDEVVDHDPQWQWADC